MAKEKKLYYVRWFTSGGYNYKDTSNVPWEGVREYKRIAKEMGERIEYENNWSNHLVIPIFCRIFAM